MNSIPPTMTIPGRDGDARRNRTLLPLAVCAALVTAAALLVWTARTSTAGWLAWSGTSGAILAGEVSSLADFPLPCYLGLVTLILILLVLLALTFPRRLGRALAYAIVPLAAASLAIGLYLTWVELVLLRGWSGWCVLWVSAAVVSSFIVLWSFRRGPIQRRHAVLILVLLAATTYPGEFYLMQNGGIPRIGMVNSLPLEAVHSHGHLFGNPLKLLVVEFGDIQCPPCGMSEPGAEQVRKKYASEVGFVFLHLPLVKIHRDAQLAAEATECATSQGMFWNMLRVLYKNQDNLNLAALERYGSQLGLDRQRFRACLADHAFASRVQQSAAFARAIGVRSTPTFFIGTMRLNGPLQPAKFDGLVRLEMAAQRGRPVLPAGAGTAGGPKSTGCIAAEGPSQPAEAVRCK